MGNVTLCVLFPSTAVKQGVITTGDGSLGQTLCNRMGHRWLYNEKQEVRAQMSLCVWSHGDGGNKLALAPSSASSHLAVLHGVAEEVVQQQVLQLTVPVKRLLDLPQEHTEGTHKIASL